MSDENIRIKHFSNQKNDVTAPFPEVLYITQERY